MKSPLRVAILALISLFIALSPHRIEPSMAQGCAQSSAFNVWAEGRQAKFYIDAAITGTQRSQIIDGLTKWTTANVNSNYSGVEFVSTATQGSADLVIRNAAPPQGIDPDAMAWYTTTVQYGEITSAVIGFNLSAMVGGVPAYDPSSSGYSSIFLKFTLHEIGHTMGLLDVGGNSCTGQTPGATVMNEACGVNDSNNSMPTNVTQCDNFELQLVYDNDEDDDGYDAINCGGTDCDDTDPLVNPGASSCPGDTGQTDKNCNSIDDYWECPPPESPIVVDVYGDGFDLTDAQGGVEFDLDGNGTPERLSWTSANSDDAWLVLDRNGNGTIDTGLELFGNHTVQPPSDHPNGFIALAVFDKAENGGNDDGQIDRRDSIFSSLRLWQDVNHNGVSEPRELRSLANIGLAVIDLDYKESRRIDQHGNQFRYRAKVKDLSGDQAGRWAWDVFLVRGQ